MDGQARQQEKRADAGAAGGGVASGVDDAPEFYLENGCVVFTAACHLKRGSCCGSGCRHCPFEPRHQAGTTTVAANFDLPARRSA